MNKKSMKKVLAMMISILLINLLLIEVKVIATNGETVGQTTTTDSEEETITDLNDGDKEETSTDINGSSEEETVTDSNIGSEEETTTDNNSDSEESITIISKDDFLTDDTFISIGGKYSIFYVLENFNVFSFKDAQSSHIVGPVIAKEKVYHNTKGSEIFIADLAKGIPSYVGNLDVKKEGSEEPSFKLNYGYEHSKPGFILPTFYSRSDYITKVEKATDNKAYFTNIVGDRVVDPNNSGNGPTKLNDGYINFSDAREYFLEESKKLLNVEAIEVSPDTNGYLQLEVGKNYNVKVLKTKESNGVEKEIGVRTVNLIYPEGYDPYTNPYPIDTIINIEKLPVTGEKFPAYSVNAQTHEGYKWNNIDEGEFTLTKIDGYNCQYFPKVFVNGEVFSGDKPSKPGAPATDESINYGEFNNIVWNLPNIKTEGNENRLVPNTGAEGGLQLSIIGHLIAPNAQFYAYASKNKGTESAWLGGNFNGAAIVDSWHGGNIEMHFYPYKNFDYGEELPPTGGQGVDKLLLLGLGMMFIALIALKRNKIYLK